MIIKVKKHQLISLFNSLTALDGPNKREGLEEILHSPYTFKAAAVYALSKNLRKIRAEVIDIEKVREKILLDVKDGNEELKGDALKKYADEYNAFLDSDTEIDVHAVKLSDLDLDNNRVPIKYLEHISLLIPEE